MKQIIIYTILALALAAPAFACVNDAECGVNAQCVVPEGTTQQAQCLTKVDSYGRRVQNDSSWGTGSGGKSIASCLIDADCGYGFSCSKQPGQTKGFCSKD